MMLSGLDSIAHKSLELSLQAVSKCNGELKLELRTARQYTTFGGWGQLLNFAGGPDLGCKDWCNVLYSVARILKSWWVLSLVCDRRRADIRTDSVMLRNRLKGTWS